VTFGEDDVYSQGDAGGFIRLFGLTNRVRALKDLELQRKNGGQSVAGQTIATTREESNSALVTSS